MTEDQKKAIAKADAKIRPALELYHERCKLAYLYYLIPLRDLRRVNRILAALTDGDLSRVVQFAESLAAFNGYESQSEYASQASGTAPADSGHTELDFL